MQLKNNTATGVALACLAALLWSGNYVVARGLHQKISPVSLAFFRWLTATLVLMPLAYQSVKQHRVLIKKHLLYLTITALLGVTLFNTFIYVAGRYSSAMNLAIIGTSAAPLFVLVLAAVFLKEKISLLQVLGALVCLAGILVLISNGHLKQLQHFSLSVGDVWILAAALAFAIYTLLVRKKPNGLSPIAFLASLFFIGTVLLLPAFIIDAADGWPFVWSGSLMAVFLYLGVGASVGAFLSWNLAIQKMGPARTALFANLIPVFSAIEAVLILGEKGTGVIVFSMAIILLGLLLANLPLLKTMRRKKM
jgi:drug/metabolite transporter (DMT)-like permease